MVVAARVMVAVLLAWLVVLATPTPAAGQYGDPPQLSAGPTAVQPGDLVTVTLTDCEDHVGATVTIFIGGIPVGTATIGPDGSFTTTVTVPAGLEGPTAVTLSCGDDDLSSIIVIGPGTDGGGGGGGDNGGGGGGGTGPGDPPPGSLPFTGTSTRPLVQLGVGLVGLGALFLFASRKRREPSRPVRGGIGVVARSGRP